MRVWLDLLLRELLFVALLAALGSAPAAFLSERFGRTIRWAMTPALGLCVGVCLTVTLAYEYPAHQTGWVVIAVAGLSIAVAVWRRPPLLKPPRWENAAGVAIVIVVILGAFNYPLATRGSVGPVGGLRIADTSGYVSETNGVQRDSVRTAEHLHAPYADLAIAGWSIYATGDQQMDVSALEANYNSVLGLGATDTQSAFLIAILLVGALGVFAAVRSAHPRGRWPAVLAGCLVAGPLFTELVMEGSQAAIAGSALLAPILVLGLDALRRRTLASLLLVGLVAAGLQTVYPLFVPCVVIGAVLVLVVLAVRAVRAHELTLGAAAVGTRQVGLVLAVSVILTPEAFERNARYWISILKGNFSFAELPPYQFPVGTLPGYVLQTREFYGLVDVLRHATTGQLLLGGLVPLLLLAVIAVAVVRSRVALAALGIAVGAALLAEYTWNNEACGYCVQRNVLPIGSLAVVALGLGLAVLVTLARRRGDRPGMGTGAAALLALMIALVVGHEGIVIRQRLIHGDYVLDQENRQALARLPARSGPVELEGYSENVRAPMELPLVYNLVDERTHGNLSYPTISDDNVGLIYLTEGAAPIGPSFKANYQYVLTRLAGVSTQRRTIARYGPIALQQRLDPLDVTIVGGVAVGPARQDPTGTAWVDNILSLRFLVVGGEPGQPAWVSLRLHASVPVAVPKTPGVTFRPSKGTELGICLRATGTVPLRAASVMPSFTPTPAPPPPNPYDIALPDRGLSLQSMRVSTRSCARR